MLIVAIPKSGSSSLIETLGMLHSCPIGQTWYGERPAPNELSLLHRYHSDMREITEEKASQLARGKKFYKQHIPPSTNNRYLLRDTKKIILLREPSEIVAAYFRADMKGIHKKRMEFDGLKTLDDWQQEAMSNGLLNDLQWFCDSWISEVSQWPDLNRIIEYSDLVVDPKSSINDIEVHFNLPLSESVELARVHYSRYSPIQDAGHKILSISKRFFRVK